MHGVSATQGHKHRQHQGRHSQSDRAPFSSALTVQAGLLTDTWEGVYRVYNQEKSAAFSLCLPRFHLICILETLWGRGNVLVFDSLCAAFCSCICQKYFVGCTSFCNMSCANPSCKMQSALCSEHITWTFNYILSFVFYKAVNNHFSLTFPDLHMILQPVPVFEAWVLVIFDTPQKLTVLDIWSALEHFGHFSFFLEKSMELVGYDFVHFSSFSLSVLFLLVPMKSMGKFHFKVALE